MKDKIAATFEKAFFSLVVAYPAVIFIHHILFTTAEHSSKFWSW